MHVEVSDIYLDIHIYSNERTDAASSMPNIANGQLGRRSVVARLGQRQREGEDQAADRSGHEGSRGLRPHRASRRRRAQLD